MAKRIVEETLANGEKRYCVQSNTLFGIPCWWSTMTILTDGGVSTIEKDSRNSQRRMGKRFIPRPPYRQGDKFN